MKKFLSLILAMIMTTALLTVGANAAWADDADNKHLKESEILTDKSVALFAVNSAEPNKWKPQNAMSRGYACRLAAYIVLGPEAAAALPKGESFSDVPENNSYNAAIKWCKELGIVSGYGDGTFKPGGLISRDAFLKILLGALNYKAAEQGYNKANGWRWEVLTDAQAAGLLEGVEIANVVKLRRDEGAKILMNALMATPVGGTEALYKTSYPALLG